MPNMRRVVRIETKPGRADAMRVALSRLQSATLTEAGCNEFRFFQAIDDGPGSFLLVEDFADAATLEQHMQMPHTKAFFSEDLVQSVAPIERNWTT